MNYKNYVIVMKDSFFGTNTLRYTKVFKNKTQRTHITDTSLTFMEIITC